MHYSDVFIENIFRQLQMIEMISSVKTVLFHPPLIYYLNGRMLEHAGNLIFT